MDEVEVEVPEKFNNDLNNKHLYLILVCYLKLSSKNVK